MTAQAAETVAVPPPVDDGVVPGAHGYPPLPEPVIIGGSVRWTGLDCDPRMSPIGAALAAEFAARAAEADARAMRCGRRRTCA